MLLASLGEIDALAGNESQLAIHDGGADGTRDGGEHIRIKSLHDKLPSAEKHRSARRAGQETGREIRRQASAGWQESSPRRPAARRLPTPDRNSTRHKTSPQRYPRTRRWL